MNYFRIDLDLRPCPPRPVIAGISEAFLSAGAFRLADPFGSDATTPFRMSFLLSPTESDAREVRTEFAGYARQFERSFTLGVHDISGAHVDHNRANALQPIPLRQ